MSIIRKSFSSDTYVYLQSFRIDKDTHKKTSRVRVEPEHFNGLGITKKVKEIMNSKPLPPELVGKEILVFQVVVHSVDGDEIDCTYLKFDNDGTNSSVKFLDGMASYELAEEINAGGGSSSDHEPKEDVKSMPAKELFQKYGIPVAKIGRNFVKRGIISGHPDPEDMISSLKDKGFIEDVRDGILRYGKPTKVESRKYPNEEERAKIIKNSQWDRYELDHEFYEGTIIKVYFKDPKNNQTHVVEFPSW